MCPTKIGRQGEVPSRSDQGFLTACAKASSSPTEPARACTRSVSVVTTNLRSEAPRSPAADIWWTPAPGNPCRASTTASSRRQEGGGHASTPVSATFSVPAPPPASTLSVCVFEAFITWRKSTSCCSAVARANKDPRASPALLRISQISPTPGSVYRVRLAVNRDLLRPRAQAWQAHRRGHSLHGGPGVGQKGLVGDMHGNNAID